MTRRLVYLLACTLTLALPGSSKATDRVACSDAGCGPSTVRLLAPPAAGTAWREEGRVEAGAEGGAERSSSPLQHCSMGKRRGFPITVRDKVAEKLCRNTTTSSLPYWSCSGLLTETPGDLGWRRHHLASLETKTCSTIFCYLLKSLGICLKCNL